MWEQIRSNKRKSLVLVFAMALVLMALGTVIGFTVFHQAVAPERLFDAGAVLAGCVGLMVAGIIWFVMSLSAYFGGQKILMAAAGARPIEKADHPQLFNVVEEMTIAAGLPKMPDIYIIEDMALNAFATGRSPDKAAVAITAGLLGRLNRDELQGVIAHEMSHVINRDVLFMQMLAVMLGAIVIISNVFLRTMFFSGTSSRRYRSSSRRGGSGGNALMMVLAILFAVLSPLLAYVIFFAASRRREYLADANATVLTRYPEGLASALEVISGDSTPLARANKATAPLFISNPFQKAAATGLASTHPPLQERIRILRTMGGNVSYRAYQQAWKKVGGKRSGVLPKSALADKKMASARKAHPDSAKKKRAPREQMREAGDLLRKVNQFLFLSCVCGLRIKLPPEFKKDHVACPRCHRDLAVPVAQMAAIGAVADQLTGSTTGGIPLATSAKSAEPKPAQGPLEIVRKGHDWMSFKCTCGTTVSLSPSFATGHVKCSGCGQRIKVKSSDA